MFYFIINRREKIYINYIAISNYIVNSIKNIK